MKSNVTLRGAGVNQTFLAPTGNADCGGYSAVFCFMGDNIWTGSAQILPGGAGGELDGGLRERDDANHFNRRW